MNKKLQRNLHPKVEMDKSVDFQPGQILFLESNRYITGSATQKVSTSRLYVELIQVVVSRQLCWVRPLLLVDFDEEPPSVADLRDASDLLWSINLFQPALDTEVITFFSPILAKEPQQGLEGEVKQQLNRFIGQLWQASQE
jgi:hypothetical protein